MLGYRKQWDTALAVEKHSLKFLGTAELAWGSQGLQGSWGCLVLRLLDNKVPLDASEELRM